MQPVSNIASDEEKRVSVLHKYQILDTPREPCFDKLTRLAADLFKVPFAFMSIVDEDRIWFKSVFGLDMQQIGRAEGLCGDAMTSDTLFLINDAQSFPNIFLNPFVNRHELRFYAAAPLRCREGFNLGTFCIMDKAPRTVSQDDMQALLDFRDLAMEHVELSYLSKLASARHQQILHTTAHDLKNPLTTVPVRADLIKLKKDDPEMVDKLCDQIKTASLNMVNIIDELLDSGAIEAGKLRLLIVNISALNLVTNVVAMNQPLAERKNQTISVVCPEDIQFHGDEGKIAEIVDNLLNNAIKYAPEYTRITVKVLRKENELIIAVSDEGQGLTPSDMSRLYQRFTRLSAQPTGGERSTGLGLSIVKVMIEAHGGRTWAESEGKGKGSTFFIALPLNSQL